MLLKLFPRLRVPPLTEQVQSRHAFIYVDRGMRAAGWIPPKDTSRRWIYRIWQLIINTFAIGLLNFGLVGSYFDDLSGFTAGQFLTSFQVVFNCFGSSIKASYTFWGVKRFKQVRLILDRLDERCLSNEQRLLLHQSVTDCNKCAMVYQVTYFAFATSTFLTGAFSGRLPWKFYNPFVDSEKSFLHFWLACVIEYLWMGSAVLQDQQADVYPIIYFMILRTHIKLLKERVRQLRTDPTMSEKDNYEEIMNCIKDHRLILDYCDTLRPVVSATIFTQFLLCGLVIGLTMINLLFFSSIWTAIATISFLTCVILQTFPFCYLCNMITDDCQELANNLFYSNWLDAPHRYKTTLLYFLHNVQQPIVLTAGGIFIISMATNITVAKLAFSVVTFVKQLNIADKFQEN